MPTQTLSKLSTTNIYKERYPGLYMSLSRLMLTIVRYKQDFFNTIELRSIVIARQKSSLKSHFLLSNLF